MPTIVAAGSRTMEGGTFMQIRFVRAVGAIAIAAAFAIIASAYGGAEREEAEWRDANAEIEAFMAARAAAEGDESGEAGSASRDSATGTEASVDRAAATTVSTGSIQSDGLDGANASLAADGAVAADSADTGDRAASADAGDNGASAAASDDSAEADAGKLDLNAATAEQLDALPGIGPTKAKAIVDYRSANGPFARVEQLTDVKGIGPAMLEKLKPLVVVGSPESPVEK